MTCLKKYPQNKFHRKSRPNKELVQGEKVPFPFQLRPAIDRAIRYVDFLIQRTKNPPAPLALYHYFNNSALVVGHDENDPGNLNQVQVKHKKLTDDQGKEQTLYDWLQYAYNQLGGSRLLNSFVEDPLTKLMKAEAASDAFYHWRIPIDPHYAERVQLERDFNSGPPLYISYQKQQLMDENKSKNYKRINIKTQNEPSSS